MTDAAEIDAVIDCIDRGGGEGGGERGGGGGGDGCILLRWIAIPRHRSHPSSLQSNPHGSTLSPSIDFLTSAASAAAPAAASTAPAAALITAFICFYSFHRDKSTFIYLNSIEISMLITLLLIHHLDAT